ncbi:MAG: hypothetical protein CL578_06000 [Alteromonadaceae bacterium]|uniref:Uncharacterized protein n=1 Tax=Paraglaciecola agarilytica NO2 TaxID=1125747 RepID=A0ABQ0I2B1_9ALTE|nr:hypothetical protein [Paraglaciecola agarilytica]MBN24585.1 hypothetical protein [Alteromonadaceae bacterium]GAC03457.1 hypothetical protein GAGA_0592 [Paraglaciecola agarilytica NO2]|tara:strand:+ start:72894 stop:73232 length:339 start_codon:yes stop_codon:yes gene_type:complete
MNDLLLAVSTLCFVEHYGVSSDNAQVALNGGFEFYQEFLKDYAVGVSLEDFSDSLGSFLMAPASFVSMINSMINDMKQEEKNLARQFIAELKLKGNSSNSLVLYFQSIEKNL